MSVEFDPGRREFLRGVGRYAALGGLLIGTGMLMARRVSAEKRCEVGLPCGGCPSFGECELPQARGENRLTAEAQRTRRG